MERNRIAALVCAALLGTTTGAAADQQTAAEPVPEIVGRAVAAYAAEVHGAIGMQRHFSFELHAGPVHHTEQSDSGLLADGGAYVKIKYYRIVRDGQPFTKQQIDERDAQVNRGWAAGQIFFKEPYDERFVKDYRFDSHVDCQACEPGVVAVGFSSDVRDTQHGRGTMWIESAVARVVKLTYVPYALPPHASSATVTEIGGRAMADLWYVTRIENTYQGHAFLLKGGATLTGTFDHFRRFSTQAEGKTALDDGTI